MNCKHTMKKHSQYMQIQRPDAPTTLARSVLIIMITVATVFHGLNAFAQNASAQISQYLPFDMPSTSDLRASPHKVFSHYFTPFPISIDNKDPSVDYYTGGYLSPTGEGDKHISYGGFFRERPLPRSPIPAANWAFLDAETDVRRAVAIGLDGFTVDLFPSQLNRVEQLMNAAQAVDPGFKLVLMPDMDGSKDVRALTKVVQTLAAYPSCYRLADGRVVVAPYDAQEKSVDWWRDWLSAMKTNGINIAFVPLFQNWSKYAAAYAPISYGFSDWGDRAAIDNAGPAWLNAASRAHQYVPVWMHPVAAQDARPYCQRYWEAENTGTLRNTWELGAIGKADWVQLITWNDYSEEAEISPSTGIQYLYYDLNAYYICWFKMGFPPPIVRDCIYYCHRMESVNTLPDPAKQTAGPLRLTGGIASDKIEAVVFLTADATLEIEINGVKKDFPVSAPRSIIDIPLQQGQPIFRLIRNGQTVAAVQSAFPINNQITYQDLLYHGGSSLRPPVTQVPNAYYPHNLTPGSSP